MQRRHLKNEQKIKVKEKSYREKGQSVRKSRLRGDRKVRHIICSCCKLVFPESTATWHSLSNKKGRRHSNVHIKTSKATTVERDTERIKETISHLIIK